MTETYSMQLDLKNCLQKLSDGLILVINVFDRIDSYIESAKLGTYIADISSDKSKKIADGILGSQLTKLETMITSNLILERFEIAMQAVKQHVFPFARTILDKFDFPSELSNDNVTFFSDEASMKIDSIIRDIKDSKTFLTEYDSNQHNNTDMLFYTWNNKEFNNDIDSMLEGKTTIFKADISKNIDQNAIKFNDIRVRFKSSNIQSELNDALNNYVVSMKMIGQMYYRCGDAIYYTSLDPDIVKFHYSFENNNIIIYLSKLT